MFPARNVQIVSQNFSFLVLYQLAKPTVENFTTIRLGLIILQFFAIFVLNFYYGLSRIQCFLVQKNQFVRGLRKGFFFL